MPMPNVVRRILLLALVLLVPTTANALFRAYLSSTGSDANACTLPSPCRLLPAALSAVDDGGEIWMLDSANYNTSTVTISKSVSILAVPGAVGSVVAIVGPAINIDSSSHTITLRNLVISMLAGSGATATDGIDVTAGSVLTVDESVIAGFPNNGLYLTGGSPAKIIRSVIRNNGIGVRLHDGGYAEISASHLLGNFNAGIYADSDAAVPSLAAGAGVVASDTVISGGTAGVVIASTGAGAVPAATLTHCRIYNVQYALQSTTNGTGSATITVGGSMVVGGYVQSGTGSVIRTLGNNQIDGAAISGALTPMALQ